VQLLFLDTGYHFPETIGTRDAVETIYDVRLINATPAHTVAEQDELLGKDLFARDPDECCRLRKVIPLTNALRGYSAWVTGIRRVDAPTRADAPLISFDENFKLLKVNPVVEEGYSSMGCAPCTTKPAAGANPRSGRWPGHSKTECGLHAS